MVSSGATSFEERVGRVLLDAEFVTDEQLEKARESGREGGEGLLDTLVSLGIVARETLMTVLSFQLRIPVVDLKSVQVDPEAVALVPEDFARQHNILPTGFEADGSLRIATMVPNDFQLSSRLSSLTGRQTKFALALSGGLNELIDRTYAAGLPSPPPQPDQEDGGGDAGVAIAPAEEGSQASVGAMGQDMSQLPAVQAVELVTLQAVKRKASDIHIVPTADSSNVLFRLDGVLQQQVMLPLRLHESMVSRIKVLAEMDISETRRPQDGSFALAFGEKNVGFRVSTIGITWGEMMVIRILDRSGGILSLEDIGLEARPLLTWRQLVECARQRWRRWRGRLRGRVRVRIPRQRRRYLLALRHHRRKLVVPQQRSRRRRLGRRPGMGRVGHDLRAARRRQEGLLEVSNIDRLVVVPREHPGRRRQGRRPRLRQWEHLRLPRPG
jgi:type IV pilus assembly protein PilB